MHAGLTVGILATLLVLNLLGVLSGDIALFLFLLIEVPLCVVFGTITVLRFKRISRATDSVGAGFLDRLETEEPLLRPVIAELQAFRSLCLLLLRKRRVPPGAKLFSYTKGTMALPTVFFVLSLVELLIVHVVVPWQWLRIVLLILTIWGVLFIAGFFATRVVHPHFVTAGVVHLRWGHRTVLTTPLSNVVSVIPHTNRSHTQPYAAGERLVLTQSQIPNVIIQFTEPLHAVAPVAKKHMPDDF